MSINTSAWSDSATSDLKEEATAMVADAPPPAAPPDMARTRQPVMGPNHAAREAAVPADAAAGRGSELPSLAVISGRHRGRRIPVPSTGIVLGREGRLASFFGDDPLVSRGHAQVYVADDRSVQVADLNSTNGTFVNGEAIRSLTRLAGKDVLRIGSIDMRLDQPGASAQPADETVRLPDVRASWPDPPAGRQAPPERRREEGRPGFPPGTAWPDAQAEAGYGPAEAGPGMIGSSSGESPGAGSSGGGAFIVRSQLRDPACAKEAGSAVATDGEHEAGMASGELLDRVRSKRAEVDKYLEFNSRRRCLLVNLVIIAGALAALLTAPPAVGGKPFTDWLQQLFHSTTPAWRFLCLFACLASLASVIAIQIQKSNNYEEHIVRAQGLRVALEVLEISITCGSLTTHEATSKFLRCLEDSSFMEPAR
jgi:pSer/pThr/pTyr-binding forkhead associated (FHA) protein